MPVAVMNSNPMKKLLGALLIALGAVISSAGGYLFLGGGETIALGVVGQKALNKADVASAVEGKASIPTSSQTLTYPGPNFFEHSLNLTKAVDPTLKGVRRLLYRCSDGSESFTVYLTDFGIFGIPSESVTCNDGSKLVDYDPSKNFVMELPKS